MSFFSRKLNAIETPSLIKGLWLRLWPKGIGVHNGEAGTNPRGSGSGPHGDGIEIGSCAPDFNLLTDEGREVKLSDYRGKKIVLYFYPKDDTTHCTRQACAFRDGLHEIRSRNAVVLGVNADSVESHKKFKDKFKLNFPLLSNTDRSVLQRFGVWRENRDSGKTWAGIERTTFLIDEQGRIVRIFHKVRVDAHLNEVLAAL